MIRGWRAQSRRHQCSPLLLRIAPSGKSLNSASWSRVYVGKSLWYIGRYLKSSNSLHTHPVNLLNSFSAKMDMLIISDRVHFSNINSLNVILFSHLTRFGKLSLFNFRPSVLSPDPFRSTGCIWCKLISLADFCLVSSKRVTLELVHPLKQLRKKEAWLQSVLGIEQGNITRVREQRNRRYHVRK